jgi:predicted metal-dependent hydrolase
VLLDLIFGLRPATHPAGEWLAVGVRRVPLRMVRHPRARRYLLRLLPDGTARVTIPRGGTVHEARSFAERQTRWLESQLSRLDHQPPASPAWVVGKPVWFRGEEVTLQSPAPGWVQLAGESVRVPETADLRPALQNHLRRLAARELPPRVLELARRHEVAVTRVSVRNQRTRWGSCSRRGVISLNWRLIQLPGFVSDYVMLHELMHRRQLNHSAAFWREVERVCPDYKTAERWLKQHAALLSQAVFK